MVRSSRSWCNCGRIGLIAFVLLAATPLVILLASIEEWPPLPSGQTGVVAGGFQAVDAQRLAQAEQRALDAERRAAEEQRLRAAAERLAKELSRNSTTSAKEWWAQAQAGSAASGQLLAPPKTGHKTPYLVTGDVLKVEEYLLAADKSSVAVMQADGHLVVYRGSNPKKPDGFMWGSGTNGPRHDWRVRMESKSFAIYRDKNFEGKVWDAAARCAESEKPGQAYFVWLHNGGRLSLHRDSPQSPGDEVWSNRLGIPVSGGKPRRYIFYERDRAGFNNVKLQLQSMVAMAAVTGRVLVLPERTGIAHQRSQYFDFDFFDASDMSSVVDIAVGKERDRDTLEVKEYLWDVDVRKLDPDRDWYFPEKTSRIQHFECMTYRGKDKAVAAHAVLNGLVFDRHLEEMATTALARLGLAGKKFDAVHIRRGDFHKFAPHFMMDDAQLSQKLKGVLHGQGRPVLVASDEKLKLDLDSEVVYASGAYSDESSFTRVAVDMLMCSRAEFFVGTPMSTFTNGIFELRTRSKMLKGANIDTTLHLYAGHTRSTPGSGSCWDKVTTFDGVDQCEKNAPRCLSPC